MSLALEAALALAAALAMAAALALGLWPWKRPSEVSEPPEPVGSSIDFQFFDGGFRCDLPREGAPSGGRAGAAEGVGGGFGQYFFVFLSVFDPFSEGFF